MSLHNLYRMAITGLLGLILWLVAAIVANLSATPWPILLIMLLPLLLALSGVLAGRPYTHAWVSLLALLYLIHGIVEFFGSPESRRWALGEIVLALMLHLGAMLFTRRRSRQLSDTPEPPPPAGRDSP
jgi:uncharacterized membrane protein